LEPPLLLLLGAVRREHLHVPGVGRGGRILASDWRISGVVSARSGSWLTVVAGRDIDGTGIANHRVNQVLDDPYGDGTLRNFLVHRR
jgi:hypothetical protein